jgi:RNA polymerase sigma-70 factor, ECF subfamily
VPPRRDRYMSRQVRLALPGPGGAGVSSPSVSGSEVAAAERELDALRAGDEGAFLALVERHHGAMLRVASQYVRSRAIAEEVVQEAWMGVLRGLHAFEGRSSLKSWIFSILVNCAKTRGVLEARSVPMSALVQPDEEVGPSVPPERFQEDHQRWAGHWATPPEPWPDARVESGELLALIAEALETLPPSQRTVMSMRDVEGLESAEVCELLHISEVNQRVLLHRARSKVRAYVEERMKREGRA